MWSPRLRFSRKHARKHQIYTVTTVAATTAATASTTTYTTTTNCPQNNTTATAATTIATTSPTAYYLFMQEMEQDFQDESWMTAANAGMPAQMSAPAAAAEDVTKICVWLK